MTSNRAARSILWTFATLVAIQVVVLAFAPGKAEARFKNWGGGYEVRQTMFGYIVACEEPTEFLALTTDTGIRQWRETMYRGYGTNLALARAERNNLNVWFHTIAATSPTVGSWWAKRCVSHPTAPQSVTVFKRSHAYHGCDGTKGEMLDATGITCNSAPYSG